MTKSCEQHMLSLVGPKPPPLPTEQEEGERFPVFLPSPARTHHWFRCEAGSGKRRNSTLKVVFARFNLAEEQDPPPHLGQQLQQQKARSSLCSLHLLSRPWRIILLASICDRPRHHLVCMLHETV